MKKYLFNVKLVGVNPVRAYGELRVKDEPLDASLDAAVVVRPISSRQYISPTREYCAA